MLNYIFWTIRVFSFSFTKTYFWNFSTILSASDSGILLLTYFWISNIFSFISRRSTFFSSVFFIYWIYFFINSKLESGRIIEWMLLLRL